MDVNAYWNELVTHKVALDRELSLITSLNGLTTETLNDVLYSRTGYRSWDQITELKRDGTPWTVSYGDNSTPDHTNK